MDKLIRLGWGEACKEMHERGEDKLVFDEVVNKFDEEEWEWYEIFFPNKIVN